MLGRSSPSPPQTGFYGRLAQGGGLVHGHRDCKGPAGAPLLARSGICAGPLGAGSEGPGAEGVKLEWTGPRAPRTPAPYSPPPLGPSEVNKGEVHPGGGCAVEP